METEMITVTWKLSIGFPGAVKTGTFEIEADASEDEIYEVAQEQAMQFVEISIDREDA